MNLLGAAAEKKDADSNCANCQYVLAIVLDTLEQRDNQDEVRNLLETACDLFPSSVSGKCEAFVDAYAEQVIQMIADNLSADEICQALQLCASPPPQGKRFQDKSLLLKHTRTGPKYLEPSLKHCTLVDLSIEPLILALLATSSIITLFSKLQ